MSANQNTVLDGFTVCQTLRDKGEDTPILMLTAKDTLEDKEIGFNVGTDDYLVKPFAMKELAMRVKALANRKSAQFRKLICADLVVELKPSCFCLSRIKNALIMILNSIRP